jgi:hypothetical protein
MILDESTGVYEVEFPDGKGSNLVLNLEVGAEWKP